MFFKTTPRGPKTNISGGNHTESGVSINGSFQTINVSKIQATAEINVFLTKIGKSWDHQPRMTPYITQMYVLGLYKAQKSLYHTSECESTLQTQRYQCRYRGDGGRRWYFLRLRMPFNWIYVVVYKCNSLFSLRYRYIFLLS